MAAAGRRADLENLLTALAQQVNTLSESVNQTNNNLAALANQQANDIATLTAALTPDANAAPSFALSPGMANVDGLIDMTSKRGLSLYESGKAALDTKFDLDVKNCNIFETELAARGKSMGWTSPNQGILSFTAADGTSIKLINQYGRIEAAALSTQCDVFINGAKATERAAQNNNMMAQCLMASLTQEARESVVAHKKDYQVIPTGQTEAIDVAPLLYKTIMRLATLDSTATVTALKHNITSVGDAAERLGGDIDKINAFITVNYNQLLARGIDMGSDAVQPILKMLATKIPDANFTKYFTQKESDYWDETAEMKGISVEDLLKKAKAKYDLLKSQGTWGVLSQEQQDIIALKAELSTMTANNLKLSKKFKDKATGSDKDQGTAQKKAGGAKKKNKKDTSNKKKQKADEAWMRVPPKDNEPKTKTVNGKNWKWCIHHMAWGLHSDDDCKLGKARAAERSNSTTVANQATTTTANQAHTNFAAYSQLMNSIRDAGSFENLE